MKRLFTFAVFFILGAALSGAVLRGAAMAAPAAKLDPNAPINISADRFLADNNAKTGTWSGNVVVTQGDIKMRANSMRVNVVGKSNKPDKILANGGVVVDSPTSGTVTGDSAVYDVAPRIVTMSGHVVLKRQKDVMRGTQLTVNLVSGQAVLGAKGSGAPAGGRVQGVFSPNDQ